MNIYLTRHAQKDTSQKQTKEEHIGRELTDFGRKQVGGLVEFIRGMKISKIYSSDMPRALQTAEILSKRLKIPIEDKCSELREVDPCPIPNLPDRDEIKKRCWADWDYKPEKGESYNEGKTRFNTYFWRNIVEKNKDSSNILLVSHGRVIRLFLSEYLKDGEKTIRNKYNYVAITHLKVDKATRKVTICKYNDNSFLQDNLRI